MLKRILSLAAVALLAACGTTETPIDQPDASGPPPCPDEKGTLCTWAGTGTAGFDGDGKKLLESQLNGPIDVAFEIDNTAFVVDWNNHRVRRVTAEGTFATVIGSGTAGDGEPSNAEKKAPGIMGTSIAINQPTDVLPLKNGSLMTACWRNHKLRRLDESTGLVQLFAGSNQCATELHCTQWNPPENGDGNPMGARYALFDFPSKMAVNELGEIFVVDQRVQRIRKISPDGSSVLTPIGTGIVEGQSGSYYGDNVLPARAKFHFDESPNPQPSGGLAFDGNGNLYIADSLNGLIRKVEFTQVKDPNTGKVTQLQPRLITTWAGKVENNVPVPGYSGDNGPALGAQLNNPTDLALGPNVLYVADTGNHVVRAINLTTRTISTVAGKGGEAGFEGDGGPANQAKLNTPRGVAVDTKGVLYISDTGNNRIRRLPR